MHRAPIATESCAIRVGLEIRQSRGRLGSDPAGPVFGYNGVGFTAVVILVLLALATLLIIQITSLIGR